MKITKKKVTVTIVKMKIRKKARNRMGKDLEIKREAIF